jgi:hypothetical protein
MPQKELERILSKTASLPINVSNMKSMKEMAERKNTPMLNDWLGQGIIIHRNVSRNQNFSKNIEVKILVG